MDTEGSDPLKYQCLCGLCHVRTGTIIISICEILILCHALIFSVTNYFAGETKYQSYNPVFYDVIKFDYLLPFLIVSILWILSNIILLIGAKIIFAPLLLPHLFVQIPAILSGVVLIVACFVNITNAARINWELMVSLCSFLLVTLAEIYFVFVVWSCYQYLKVTRVAVSAKQKFMESAQFDFSDEEMEREKVETTKNSEVEEKTDQKP